MASEKVLHLEEGKPIIAALSDCAMKEQTIRQRYLTLLFRCVRFLAGKGLSFRGNECHEGVLYDLMLERSEEDPELMRLMRKRDNWLSDTVQNEIIEMYSHAIQREISARVITSGFFGFVQIELPTY